MKTAQLPTKKLQTYMLGSVLVLLVSAGLAHSGNMPDWEISIFRWVNGWPNSLHVLFLTLTQAGSAWMLFGVTLLLLAYQYNRLALRVFCGGAAAFLLAQVFKHMVGRPRPPLLLNHVAVRERLLGDFGFPSAHTAVATAVSLALIGVVPKRWRWLCGLWIVAVAVSRVYLGVHAPLDVIGGFAIGALVVCASFLIHGKLKTVRKITGLKLD